MKKRENFAQRECFKKEKKKKVKSILRMGMIKIRVGKYERMENSYVHFTSLMIENEMREMEENGN